MLSEGGMEIKNRGALLAVLVPPSANADKCRSQSDRSEATHDTCEQRHETEQNERKRAESRSVAPQEVERRTVCLRGHRGCARNDQREHGNEEAKENGRVSPVLGK